MKRKSNIECIRVNKRHWFQINILLSVWSLRKENLRSLSFARARLNQRQTSGNYLLVNETSESALSYDRCLYCCSFTKSYNISVWPEINCTLFDVETKSRSCCTGRPFVSLPVHRWLHSSGKEKKKRRGKEKCSREGNKKREKLRGRQRGPDRFHRSPRRSRLRRRSTYKSDRVFPSYQHCKLKMRGHPRRTVTASLARPRRGKNRRRKNIYSAPWTPRRD